jgi:hypothetical protein
MQRSQFVYAINPASLSSSSSQDTRGFCFNQPAARTKLTTHFGSTCKHTDIFAAHPTRIVKPWRHHNITTSVLVVDSAGFERIGLE